MADKSRCSKMVMTGDFHAHLCTRKPWKDGRCRQHHPETEAAKAAKKDALCAAATAAWNLSVAVGNAEQAVLAAAEECWLSRHESGHEASVELLYRAMAELHDSRVALAHAGRGVTVQYPS